MYKMYMEMAEGGEIVIDLSVKEEAAVLAAYDNGINNVDNSDYKLIQCIINKIKNEIWEN